MVYRFFRIALLLFLFVGQMLAAATPIRASENFTGIHIDRFGYFPQENCKLAVIAGRGAMGSAASQSHSGPVFFIREAETGRSMFEGRLSPWREAEIDPVSGDRVWHFDFSAFRQPGTYYITDDRGSLKSSPLKIDHNLFEKVLYHATRVFFYQRCGFGIGPLHGRCWHHDRCHLQQRRTPMYGHSAADSRFRDLTGGWHDAGDYNKYVPNLNMQVMTLMQAYLLSQPMWDRFNLDIPGAEGVPDVIMEIKWGIDWLRKMQDTDGGVFNRVGGEKYSGGRDDPATDAGQYFYTQKTTWATATFCSVMARAYRIFSEQKRQFPGFAKTLRDASEKAWAYLKRHPELDPSSGKDQAELAAGDAGSDPFDDRRRRLLAAAEMFASTGGTEYRKYFESHFQDTSSLFPDNENPIKDSYIDTGRSHDVMQAYFTYAMSPLAENRHRESIMNYFAEKGRLIEAHFDQKDDSYLAYIYNGAYAWGSNMTKMLWPMFLVYRLELGGDQKREKYLDIITQYIHYLHGRNPLSRVYLSNMGVKGAGLMDGNSVMELFHYWFRDGSELYDGKDSKCGPAPGFLTGGPNQYYSGSFSGLKRNPPMKAYKDWNTGWPENSWEINEPSLSYQAAYVLVLSYLHSRRVVHR
jgi:hypothetical protein